MSKLVHSRAGALICVPYRTLSKPLVYMSRCSTRSRLELVRLLRPTQLALNIQLIIADLYSRLFCTLILIINVKVCILIAVKGDLKILVIFHLPCVRSQIEYIFACLITSSYSGTIGQTNKPPTTIHLRERRGNPPTTRWVMMQGDPQPLPSEGGETPTIRGNGLGYICPKVPL